jgi:hypothetical protein
MHVCFVETFKPGPVMLINICSVQFQFTDGAGSQFRSKQPFLDVASAQHEHGLDQERSFFGSSHGKGPCDGLGGIVKAATTRGVLANEVNMWQVSQFHGS